MESIKTISQVSKEYGITPRALRFYEEQKLISPHRRGSNRFYDAKACIRVQLILRGKRLGFSLLELRKILSDGSDNRELWAMLTPDQISKRIKELSRRLDDVTDAISELKRVS